MIGIIVSTLINRLIIEDLQTSIIIYLTNVKILTRIQGLAAMMTASFLILLLKGYTTLISIKPIYVNNFQKRERPAKNLNYALLFITNANSDIYHLVIKCFSLKD